MHFIHADLSFRQALGPDFNVLKMFFYAECKGIGFARICELAVVAGISAVKFFFFLLKCKTG